MMLRETLKLQGVAAWRWFRLFHLRGSVLPKARHVLNSLLPICLLLLCLSAEAGSGKDLPVLLVIHNSFVSAEKFQRLQPLAAQGGVQLQSLDVSTAPLALLKQGLQGASLVVLDTPRGNDRSMVKEKIGALLAEMRAPILMIGGANPYWERMDERLAQSLTAYYAEGGRENFLNFFSLARAAAEHTPLASELPEVVHFPTTGFYHPSAPEIFKSAEDYLSWALAHRPGRAQPLAGRVAFLIYRGVVGDLVTGRVDALIVRTEAAGLLPLVFWFDDKEQAGLAGLLGNAQIDALVNLTHMQNGSQRSKDFLSLDVPVIQTLTFRDGEAKDWPQASSGISPQATAIFLAAQEAWGISDPLILSASTNGRVELLPQQADLLIDKLKALVRLRYSLPADRKLALMFWNYPAGEKNLAASNLNVPRSIVSIRDALAQANYQIDEINESQVIAAGQLMLGALYRSVTLEELLSRDMAALYPLAHYQRWLSSLPAEHQKALQNWGDPVKHWAVRKIDGERYFIIPRWQLGNLLIMPQMPRAAEVGSNYHDTSSAPDHLYLASYLYLQQIYDAHALIHLGTHGTQEWLPGKDRGLAASDYPFLAAGALPIFYPYIQDNIGEAIQAKRRGRAVTISHQTPPFAPAGLYDVLRDLHDLIHEYLQLDLGLVRDQSRQQIIDTAIAANMHRDLEWTPQQIEADFDVFLQDLHDHMHELARVAIPLGLHTFGQAATAPQRISTVMQQLGEPFYQTLGSSSLALFAGDFQALQASAPYLALQGYLLGDAQTEAQASSKQQAQTHQHGHSHAHHHGHSQHDTGEEAVANEALPSLLQRGEQLYKNLEDTQENEVLLAALGGHFVPPGAGGDPIRNPDIRSGRNLYAFEADRIPAKAAYESAKTAFKQLLHEFAKEHDAQFPKKLVFSLWSSEAIRHLGVTEAQVLHALGLKPVWDAGGHVRALEIIPAAELGRPRVDVVIQVTSVYRDQFDSFMRLLDKAMIQLSELDEADNPIAANNRRISARLQQLGMAAEAAQQVARSRIFGSAPGRYGTGVSQRALQSTLWEDDSVLAKQFLETTQYAYGQAGWGEKLEQANLFSEQLRGAQAVVMARSSNIYGVLSTDHPFEFLGGLSAAIRHLDGQAPLLYISDLRNSRQISTTALQRFLADELRALYLNPHWIKAIQQEGYAGTLEVLNVSNNLFGWQVMDPRMVREDQWQAMFDTWVADTRELGTAQWFEQHNPTAQAQILERMAEAIRKGYWDASDATRKLLVARWQELAQQFEVTVGDAVTQHFIAETAQGFGLSVVIAPEVATTPAVSPTPTMDAPANDAAVAAARQNVQGQVLEQQTHDDSATEFRHLWALAVMLLLLLLGMLVQLFEQRRIRRRLGTADASH